MSYTFPAVDTFISSGSPIFNIHGIFAWSIKAKSYHSVFLQNIHYHDKTLIWLHFTFGPEMIPRRICTVN